MLLHSSILRFGPVRPAIFALLLSMGLTAYGDIVVDGNFEGSALGALAGSTVQFSGSSIDSGAWNVTQGSVGVDTRNFYVYDGNKSIFLNGDSGGPDSLEQTLNTVVGETYTVGFWANADTSNTFSVTFGGLAVNGAPTSILANGFPSTSWLGNSGLFQYYSGTVTATSAISDLVFTATNMGSGPGVTVEIDDVSVNGVSANGSVPEPASIALFATVIAGVGLVGRKHLAERFSRN